MWKLWINFIWTEQRSMRILLNEWQKLIKDQFQNFKKI
jgi:hypothetical protein